jgi:hypothetical protein
MTQNTDYALACPNCGSVDLDTLEIATCIAECERITPAGPEFSGTTDYERGDQATIGVICNDCIWQYEGDDWLTKLVPEVVQIDGSGTENQ